ncbi:MAG: hypothetical protein ACETVM_00445 [Candidatus Bathyarchaeia archaeon]
MNLKANKFILGHMPFVGVSYQSAEKDKEYRRRFCKISATKKVAEAALKMGVHRFAGATPRSSPLSPVHLEAIRVMIDEGHGIELLPCIEIPVRLGDDRINAFRRWATYIEFERRLYPEVRGRMFNDPILNFREDWKNRLSASKPYEDEDFRKLTVEWNDIDEDLEFFAELPVGYVEFGSETDFLAMTGRFDLLGELIGRTKAHGFKNVLFGVHHAGMTIPLLNDKLEGFHGYVTLLNPLGVMMFPTKRSAERAVRSVEKAVYAIKPLAGGRVSPKRAFTYVFNFQVEGCMIGVGSVPELKEDIKAAIEALERINHKRMD